MKYTLKTKAPLKSILFFYLILTMVVPVKAQIREELNYTITKLMFLKNIAGFAYHFETKQHGIATTSNTPPLYIEVECFYTEDMVELTNLSIKNSYEYLVVDDNVNRRNIDDARKLRIYQAYIDKNTNGTLEHHPKYEKEPVLKEGFLGDWYYSGENATDSRAYFQTQAHAAGRLQVKLDRSQLDPSVWSLYNTSVVPDNLDDIAVDPDHIKVYIKMTIQGDPSDLLELDLSNITISIPGVAAFQASDYNKIHYDILNIDASPNPNESARITKATGSAADVIGYPVPLTVRGNVYIDRDFTGSEHLTSMPYSDVFNLYVGGSPVAIDDLDTPRANGSILTENYAIQDSGSWFPDFVFDNNYQLRSLKALEQYVKTHKHLPEVPNKSTIRTKGYYSINNMLKGTLQNMEELYLDVIRQNKTLTKQQTNIYQKIQEVKALQNTTIKLTKTLRKDEKL